MKINDDMKTTNYTRKGSRNRSLPPQKDKVVIDAAEYEDNPVREYVCSDCNFILHTRKTQGETECLHCGSLLQLDKIQEISVLEDPNEETETLVSSIPSPYEKDVAIRHEPELKGSFLALQQKGLRIKDYQEHNP